GIPATTTANVRLSLSSTNSINATVFTARRPSGRIRNYELCVFGCGEMESDDGSNLKAGARLQIDLGIMWS
ncbi:hypothetical protein Godav_013509, partial [Gossypium davidsonii]|nr:hypothetical protein [Gossypium davidsonii]MBA0648184.1 hypothetical protein [Gossypium klotzschianum]